MVILTRKTTSFETVSQLEASCFEAVFLRGLTPKNSKITQCRAIWEALSSTKLRNINYGTVSSGAVRVDWLCQKETETSKAIIEFFNFFLTYYMLGLKVKLTTIYSMSKGNFISFWRDQCLRRWC
jgi:hypothetical protein